jgi:hypothetical protein
VVLIACKNVAWLKVVLIACKNVAWLKVVLIACKNVAWLKAVLIACKATTHNPALLAGTPNRPDQPVFFRLWFGVNAGRGSPQAPPC